MGGLNGRPHEARVGRRLLWIQVMLTGLMALLAGILGGQSAWSALIGGLLVILASLIFSMLVFHSYRAQQPGKVLGRIYLAEVVKLVFVVAGFALVFKWFDGLDVVALFASFFIVQVVSGVMAQYRNQE